MLPEHRERGGGHWEDEGTLTREGGILITSWMSTEFGHAEM